MFQYVYTVDSDHFSMSDYKFETIKIDGSRITLRGGTTYTFIVRGKYHSKQLNLILIIIFSFNVMNLTENNSKDCDRNGI